MAKFRISGPDGGVYEVNAPDDATEDQVLSYVQQNTAGRSFAQPKLAASANAANEPSFLAGVANQAVDVWNQGVDVANQGVRGINRGINAAMSLPGEMVGGAVNMAGDAINMIAPGTVEPGQGDRFKFNNAVSEFMSSPNSTPQTDAGRYADSIGQALGGNIIPGAGIAMKARQAVPAAKTTIGAIGQNIVNAYRTNPGAAVATDAISATGAGIGLQLAKDLDLGPTLSPTGQVLGGLVGGLAPFGAAAAYSRAARSPMLARYRTSAPAGMEPQPQSAGAAVNPMLAAGDPTPPVTGADAAAYQYLANQAAAAGVKPGQLGARLEQSDIDAIGGRSAFGLVELDPSYQRIAGSLVRQNLEASNYGQRFVAGRQTGITPLDGMPENSGIPTRQFMEQKTPIDPPAGMYERMQENVRGYLQVPPRSAYRVDQDLFNIRKQQAQANYSAAYDAASTVNIAPVLDTVLDKWSALANDPRQLKPIAKRIEKAVNIFKTRAGTVEDLKRFQDGKELLDEEISGLMESPVGRNKKLGGVLNDFKKELLAAVDEEANIGPAGPLYKGARDVFSSTSELRDALEMGRNALKDGSEVSADAYRAMSAGEQQMFRIGLADPLDRLMAAQKRGADVTQTFQKPSVQEMLMEVGPQDQAMRFGRNIQSENTITRTNNEVFGNSKTQQRAVDDEAFNQMGDTIEAIKTAQEAVRSSRSLTDAGFNLAKGALERLGGFRADAAMALARKLFTADRAELDVIIREIDARIGPTKSAQFQDILDRYRASVARQSATSTAVATQQVNQPQTGPLRVGPIRPNQNGQNDLFNRPPG
tara:strand:+ start:6841 stop:9291 length:2451 start_codon:yes stop_codon:yes gene_type:complete